MNELIDHLTVAIDEEYIDQIQFDKMVEKTKRNVNILNGYIAYLKRRKDEG